MGSKTSNCKKCGIWGVYRKRRFGYPPNIGGQGIVLPKTAPEKHQKDDMNHEIVLKKRRNVRGLGCVREINQEMRNCEIGG